MTLVTTKGKSIFSLELTKLIKIALENFNLANYHNGIYSDIVEKQGLPFRFSCRAKVSAEGKLLTDLTAVWFESVI